MLQLRFPGDTAVQLAGTALLAVGLILAFWSLRAIEPGALTTTGPYAYVRHPMYTGYVLAFAGLFPLTLNLLALLPLLAIPSQIAVARCEEACSRADTGRPIGRVRGADRAVLAADAVRRTDGPSLNNPVS